MKFIRLKIPDIILIEPDVHGDTRGFFYESYRRDLFQKNGIRAEFVQDNHSSSTKGVLRGLHYQIAPHAQAKLVRVLRGEAFDVAVDIRKNSKTFGQCVSLVLSEKNKKMLYIPAGFAHGFLALQDNTEILYQVSGFYSPKHERGVLWDDPSLKIKWPTLSQSYILSKKDQSYPLLKGSNSS